MKIAIEGCCHGQLDAIYQHIASLEERNQYKVDLLLICGDFQAVRNHQDLQCMSVPNKYKDLGGFHKYYTGQATAPILTIVIGGNHEASNYFQELYHGGWIAPNMYFLGHAGCIQVNGIRIAGASGIFKRGDFNKGLYERVPYDNDALRSIYHIREYNVRRLSLLSSPDIFLSHDWPQSIEQHGDVAALLRHKQYFREEVKQGTLGSPPLMGLLQTLKPQWWFSAHLHTKFSATVIHMPAQQQAPTPSVPNPDEIMIDDEDDDDLVAPPTATMNPDEIVFDSEDVEPRSAPELVSDSTDGISVPENHIAPPSANQPKVGSTSSQTPSRFSETHFLALDKCLPRRGFLEVIDYPSPIPVSEGQPVICFDPEWLAITRAFHPLLSTQKIQRRFPPEHQAREMVHKASKWVHEHVFHSETPTPKQVEGVQTFVLTAPGPDLSVKAEYNSLPQPPWFPNPQTEGFCKMLGIENNTTSGKHS